MTERAEIVSLIRTAYATRYRGDLDGLMKFFHPECRYQLSGSPEVGPMCTPQSGCEAVRQQMAGLIDAFHFANVEELDFVVEGDRAVYHWRADVTFAPTGRTGAFEVLDLFTIEDGRIKSLTQFTDTVGVARLSAA
jgi:ketosteroid isomerase-like protein